MEPSPWVIVIKVTPTSQGDKVDISTEPRTDMYPDHVLSLLIRAATFYERKLSALETINTANELQRTDRIMKGIKLS